MAGIITALDIIKLRRFSLAFGLLLFTFSVAGVEIDSPAKISPLGIPLVIKQLNLFGISLVLGSLYSLLRYWYYGVLIGLSPRKARKRLIEGTLIDGATTVNGSNDSPSTQINHFREEAQRQVDSYFPTIPGLSKLEIRVQGDGCQYRIELPTIPFNTKLLIFLHDVDYYAPIWVNLIAISIYFAL